MLICGYLCFCFFLRLRATDHDWRAFRKSKTQIHADPHRSARISNDQKRCIVLCHRYRGTSHSLDHIATNQVRDVGLDFCTQLHLFDCATRELDFGKFFLCVSPRSVDDTVQILALDPLRIDQHQTAKAEARQLLDSQKGDERRAQGVPFARKGPDSPPDKPVRDW